MCGRYNRKTPLSQLATLFDCTPLPAEAPPRYNIAPTQPVIAVRLDSTGARELTWLRWGLVPFWADDLRIGNRLLNARSETVASKPAFRAAFKQRRCLLPADGFYEWQKLGAKLKQPFCIRRRDGQPLAFAGLWEHWQKDQAPPLETCTILTTSANDLMKPLHDRMPVILAPTDWERWLAVQTPKAAVEQLLQPYAADDLEAFPVSPWVNSPRHDDQRCLEPAGAGGLFP